MSSLFSRGNSFLSQQGDQVFYTNADVNVEKSILETLQYYFPKYSYITEESGEIKGDENTIVIDPIDGTSNFIHGIPFVSIVISKMKPHMLQKEKFTL